MDRSFLRVYDSLVECGSYVSIGTLSSICNFRDKLPIIILNIRSYTKNIDHFLMWPQSEQFVPNMVVLTETYGECVNCALRSLSVYDVYYTKLNKNRNDGVIVYLNEQFGGSAEEIFSGNVTCSKIGFTVNGKCFEVLALYRSPSDCQMSFLGFLPPGVKY